MADHPPPYNAQPGYNTGYPPPRVTTVTATPSTVLLAGPTVVGVCPHCRSGLLEDDYPILAWCLALCFFPLGVLCCLAMRQKRCTNCGAVFGL